MNSSILFLHVQSTLKYGVFLFCNKQASVCHEHAISWSMDPWEHGPLGAWTPGCIDPWEHGPLGAWTPGCMDPWVQGVRVAMIFAAHPKSEEDGIAT